MKKPISDSVLIPEGVSCLLTGAKLECSKQEKTLSLKLPIPKIRAQISEGKIVLFSEKGNKIHWKIIRSNLAHIRNLFTGLDKKYICTLEVCNVHFPVTLKIDSGKLIINNFLGERVPRKAVILPDVEIEIKGPKITLTSLSKESVGQTAANIEIATKVRARDRRIFQDGIFITKKPEVSE